MSQIQDQSLHRQGYVWLTQGFVQITITEPRAVNKKHWSPSASLVPLGSGLGSWFVLGLLIHFGRCGNVAFCTTARHPQPQCRKTEDEARARGNPDASFSSGINTFTGKCMSKMHLKPGKNWLCCPSELGANTPQRNCREWDSKRSLQGLGSIPNECRTLCSHITIISNLNVHQPVILTSNICSLDCYFSRFLCGGRMRKTNPYFSQQRHEKLQELNNTSQPAPQTLPLWEPTGILHRSCGCPTWCWHWDTHCTVFRAQSQYSTSTHVWCWELVGHNTVWVLPGLTGI